MLVVADTSPLILLARIGCLELLRGLGFRVVVPERVWHEAVGLGAALPGSSAIRAASYLEVRPLPQSERRSLPLPPDLGPGETDAICMALDLDAALVLIDDRSGRRAAERLGLRVRGTLGVVAEAKRRGLLLRLAPVLEDLEQAGAWISPELRRKVLSSVGE